MLQKETLQHIFAMRGVLRPDQAALFDAAVVKALKKGETGLSIIAGDISPVEVICHVPILCEEKQVAYIYVPSKEDLGLASMTKRPTSIVLVTSRPDYAEQYQEAEKKVRSILPKDSTRKVG